TTFRACVADGDASSVLVTGAPGVGKSRLAEEFLRWVREESPRTEIWVGRGDPVSSGSAFGLIAPALRRAAGVLDSEPVAVRRAKIWSRVGRHLRDETERERVVHFIGELVGIPFEQEGSIQLRVARTDAMLMGDQIRKAWEDLVAAELHSH